MPVRTQAELKAQIKEGVFDRFYLIFGEDQYYKQYFVRKILSAAVQTLPEMNISKYDGQTTDMQTIADDVLQTPVMSEYRCVLLTDFDANQKSENDLKDLKQILSDLPESTVLLFYCDTVELNPKKPGKWKSILTVAEKQGAVVDCAYKTVSELTKILCALATRRKSALSAANAKYLIELCGRDYQVLQMEVEKLSAYKAGQEIQKEDIEKLSVKVVDANQYALPKALFALQTGKAVELIGELFNARVEPVVILSVLIDAFVDAYRAKAAVSAGVQPAAAAGLFGYAKNRAFVLENAAVTAKKTPVFVLRDCLELLAQADKTLKTTASDPRFLLEKTAIQLIEKLRRQNG